MILMTLVHGNDDVISETFHTEEEAMARATYLENERHGGGIKPLHSRFDWRSDRTAKTKQFGTNYHYVVFSEVS